MGMPGRRKRRRNASALGAGEKHAAVVYQVQAAHGVGGGLELLKRLGRLRGGVLDDAACDPMRRKLLKRQLHCHVITASPHDCG